MQHFLLILMFPPDIRDRARFYYCLLTNVSSKKCSKILTTETVKPGLPHVIADDITTSTFPVPPPVKHISSPFLKLTRVPRPKFEGSLTDLKSSDLGETKEFISRKGLLDQYLKMVDGNAYSKEIPIKYYVHFTDSATLPIPSIIYALVLKFHTERRYKKLEDIHISYLSAAKSTSPSEGCYVITVNFCPLDPVPTVFKVRVTFSDEKGLTSAMQLENLLVQFSDLFNPLQVPAYFKTTPVASVKAELFSVLWDHIVKVQRTSEYPTGTGAESIISLSVKWSTMREILEEYLLPFVMSASDDEVQLGIFLPPCQHLLLKFHPLNDLTVVSMATDDWRLLQLVESYLRQFEHVSR